MNSQNIQTFVECLWQQSVVDTLCQYIKIPALSPCFDAQWEQAGHLERAIELVVQWCRAHAPRGMQLQVLRLPGRTPTLFLDIPGQGDRRVLLYGHLDKQPEMTGWEPELGPWQPVIRDGKLYGRGGADDGYAIFAAMGAILSLQNEQLPHPPCSILIELSEESGSPDLPFYLEAVVERMGQPELVIGLDSGAGNYQQLWLTSSLRGNVVGELSVEITNEGLHSGLASGIVPSTFRIARTLLDRIEDATNGAITLPEAHVPIPEQRIEQAQSVAHHVGTEILSGFPFVPGAKPVNDDVAELLLNRTWRACLEITGVDGIPPLSRAGNVLRPKTSLTLSLRTPPTADSQAIAQRLKTVLEQEPPYGAKVAFEIGAALPGWHANPTAAWLDKLLQDASQTYFGQPAEQFGEGGSIPFMGMLGDRFPQAQFMIVGVLGPKSNAHGPNEFLHLDMAKKITCCVAHVLAHMAS